MKIFIIIECHIVIFVFIGKSNLINLIYTAYLAAKSNLLLQQVKKNKFRCV